MIPSKKGQFDDVLLKIFLIVGVLIIAIWFIGFVGKQSIKSQNITFEALNDFTEYYKLVCSVDEARLTGVEINVIRGTIIDVNKKQVCIEAKSIIRTCNAVVCDLALFEGNFTLEEKRNYFNFEKTTDGQIYITKD